MSMRNQFLAVAIALVMATPCTFASAQSLQGYVTTKGAKQGQFKGQTSPSSPKPTGAVNPISPATNPTLQGNAVGKGDARGGSPPSTGWDLKANKKF
jgi:hypothetical protein